MAWGPLRAHPVHGAANAPCYAAKIPFGRRTPPPHHKMVRNLVLGAFALLASFWTYVYYDRSTEATRALRVRDERIARLEMDNGQKTARIEALDRQVERLEAEVDRLELARQLLRLDHRIARIEVLRQGPPEGDTAAGDTAAGDAAEGGTAGGNAEPAATETTVRFTELDAEGGPIGPPKELTIPGTRLYVEGIVVKFGDEYVEEGDPLRGTSICLLQRLFSEEMAPEDGLELDSVNQHPLPFTGDDLPDPLYRDLFQRVWDYANDPEAAERIGVRAIQAEAPSMEVRPGRTDRLELRQSGGMTLRAER